MNGELSFCPYFESTDRCLIVGPSQSGKSTLLLEILADEKAIQPQPSTIVYIMGVKDDIFRNKITEICERVRKITPIFYYNLNDFDVSEFDSTSSKLLILDDLMKETGNSIEISNMFTRTCHHMNWLCLCLQQSLFVKGKCSRDLVLNSTVSLTVFLWFKSHNSE